MNDTAIKIQKLTKTFGSFKAVDALDLDVTRGEIFGFLGPNGAGKTTTLRMLAGLSKPDSGEISLLGTDVSFGSMKGRERIGYLPDVPECYGYMKPIEFLCFCGDLFGLDAGQQKKKAMELLELVGLQNEKKRIGGFSRGMKQRIGIAQALVNDPDIVLMDEPASALDPMGRYDVMEIMTRLKGKTTVFFSTHIITDIERVCDTVAILNKGTIVEKGSIAELKSKYDNNTLSVSFSSDSISQAINDFKNVIQSRDWCRAVATKTDDANAFLITVSDRSVAQKELPGMIASLNLPLESMNSVSLSLEDVFLKVVAVDKSKQP